MCFDPFVALWVQDVDNSKNVTNHFNQRDVNLNTTFQKLFINPTYILLQMRIDTSEDKDSTATTEEDELKTSEPASESGMLLSFV